MMEPEQWVAWWGEEIIVDTSNKRMAREMRALEEGRLESMNA